MRTHNCTRPDSTDCKVITKGVTDHSQEELPLCSRLASEIQTPWRACKHGDHMGMIPRTCAHTARIHTNSITHRHMLGSLCRNLRVGLLCSRRVIRLVMMMISWSAAGCVQFAGQVSPGRSLLRQASRGGKKKPCLPACDDVTQNPRRRNPKKYVSKSARIQVRSLVRTKSPPTAPTLSRGSEDAFWPPGAKIRPPR